MAGDKALAEFGKIMMTHLRDRAIEFYKKAAKNEWRAPSLKKLQLDLQKLTTSQRKVVQRCVVSAIDHAIHDFLFHVQEESDNAEDPTIEIRVRGKNVARLSDGLHGEAFTDSGWQAQYSAFGKAPKND
jgi:hypothetical protein